MELAKTYDIALEMVGVPTWANPADAPSRDKTDSKLARIVAKGFRLHRPQSFRQTHALPELYLLRDPLSEAAHRAGKHVRKLASFQRFEVRKRTTSHR